MARPLLPEHVQILQWLSREETSALGECFGAALWRLLGEGYATIEPATMDREWSYARVRLTPKGFTEAINPKGPKNV